VSLVEIGVFRGEAESDCFELAMGLLDGDPGLEPAECGREVEAAGTRVVARQGVEVGGEPDVELGARVHHRRHEIGRHHADDGSLPVVDPGGPSQDR